MPLDSPDPFARSLQPTLSTSLSIHLLDTNSYQTNCTNPIQFASICYPHSYEKSNKPHLSNCTNLVQLRNLAPPSSTNTPLVMVLTNASACLPTHQHRCTHPLLPTYPGTKSKQTIVSHLVSPSCQIVQTICTTLVIT